MTIFIFKLLNTARKIKAINIRPVYGLWFLPSCHSCSVIFLYLHGQKLLPLPAVGIFSTMILFILLFKDNHYFTEKIKLNSLTFPQIFCLHTYNLFIIVPNLSLFSCLIGHNFLCSKVIFLISSNLIIIILIIVNIYHLLGTYYVSGIILSSLPILTQLILTIVPRGTFCYISILYLTEV